MQEIFRELLIVSKLGLPVTLIYLTDVGMAPIATIPSGQYSSAALAAVGLSNILYLTALTFFMMALYALFWFRSSEVSVEVSGFTACRPKFFHHPVLSAEPWASRLQ